MPCRMPRAFCAFLLVLNFLALANCLTININENVPLNSAFNVSIGTATSVAFKTKPSGFNLLTNGTLIVQTALDYEKTKQYTYTVSATRPGGTQDEQLTINVMDINDVAPVINRPIKPTNFYPKGLPENATAVLYRGRSTLDGAVVYCVQATDVDTTANLTFDFFPATEMDSNTRNNFRIVAHLGCIVRKGNTDLSSTQTVFKFPIRVRDVNSAVPQNSAAYVTVNAHVNPLPPQIGANPYVIEFPEKTAANTKIGTIGALPLTNTFATLTYALTPLEPYEKPWPFTFNTANGDLTVTKVFVFNRTCKYEWHALVEVTENATLKSTAKVAIVLTDLNDNRPFFQQSMYFNGKPAMENVTTGEIVLNVEATDADSTSGKDLVYTLHGTYASMFKITTNPTTAVGEIRPANALDFESLGVPKAYPLTVSVTDGVAPSATTSALIYVMNVNDNAPVFSSQNKTTVQVQRSSINRVVFQAHAYDADGSTVKYYFKGKVLTDSLFTINEISGAVTYKTQAAATLPEYQLTIVAYDNKDCTTPCVQSDTELKSTELLLTVRFLDKNTVAPKFSNCPDTLSFSESKKKGDVVYTLTATDSDIGLDGKVFYELKPNSFTSNPETYVTINNSTGVIQLNRNYDRESDTEKYNGLWAVWITVMARDSGTNQLRTYCTMRIHVTDVNDNVPVFDSAGDPYVTGIFNGTQAINTKVIQVFAIDADEFGTANSIVVYGQGSNFPSFLKIDTSTGWISFSSAMNNFPNGLYEFQVTARNSAPMVPSTTSSTVTHTVRVYVVNSRNLLPPTVVMPGEDVTIPETYDNYQSVMTGSVSIVGGTLNSENLPGSTTQTNKGVAYFRLFLNGSDVTIRKIGNIDATFIDHIYFRGRISRVGGKYGSGTSASIIYTDIRLLINITDVNNQIPSFIIFGIDRRNRDISMPENANNTVRSGNPVATLFAADKDVVLNYRKITYGIEPNPFFTVVGNGLYTLNNVTQFDFESTVRRYTITVIAEDSAPSVLPGVAPKHNRETKQIHVSITDVNDNEPYFPQTSYDISVNENVQVGQSFFTLKAIDRDTVNQNTLTYSMENKGYPFGIDAYGGFIYATRPLNYEGTLKVFPFTVTVFDGRFSNTTSVTIRLVNVKDSYPVFSDAVDGIITPPSFNVGSPPSPLLKLNVTDKDAEAGTVNVFAEGRWVNTFRYFNVPAGTKDLRVVDTTINPTKNILRSDNKYHFTLKAVDGNMTSYAQVVVTVTNPVNTKAPCFDMATLNGFQVVGTTTAMTVKAFDDDGNAIRFSIPDAGTGFTINPTTGVVSSTTAPTAVNTMKMFNITVSDNSRSTTGVATVTVIGRNTVAPSCLKSPYVADAPTNLKLNQVFFAVIAGNLAAPDRNKVKYTIKNAADREYFGIRNIPALDAGGLFMVKALPNSNPRTIVVAVANAAGVSKECNVQVRTVPGNKNAPVITTATTLSSVPETAGASKVLATPVSLATFTATDTDPNDKAFVFSLDPKFNTGANPGFELQTLSATQARLLQVKSLDRELLTSGTGAALVKPVVYARDQVWPYKTGTATFTLTVTDVPETPSFPTNVVPYVNVAAGVNAPTVPAKLSATPTGTYTYSKDATSPVWTTNPPFNLVTPSTGDSFSLTAARSLTVDATNPYIRVPVVVNTRSGTPLSTVTVTVGLQTSQLRNIEKQVRATLSYGTPNARPLNLGSIYGLPLFGADAVGVTYAFTSNPYPNYFSLNTTTGDVSIVGSTPAANYTLVGTVRRGSASATATMKIEATGVGLQALANVATLRLSNMTTARLVERKKVTTSGGTSRFEPSILDQIRTKIAALVPTTFAKVQIVSIVQNTAQKYVNIYYVASGSPYFTPAKLNALLALNKANFETITGVKIGTTPIDQCAEEPQKCPNGCTNKLKINQDSAALDRQVSSTFMGMQLSTEAVCGCGIPAAAPPVSACGVDSCLNEGNCTVTPGTKSIACACPVKFEGPRCQQLYTNFATSNGYLFTEPIGSCGDIHMSFEFVTKQSGRVTLLYTGPIGTPTTQDRMAIELNNGVPQVSITVNKVTATLAVANPNPLLNNGQWHRLDIWYKNGKLQLMLDRCTTAPLLTYDGTSPPDRSRCYNTVQVVGVPVRPTLRRLNTAVDPLQVGGSTVTSQYPVGLIGGIGMLRVNGVIRNLVGTKSSYNQAADSNTAMTRTCYSAANVPVCGPNSICRQNIDGGAPLCTCKPMYRKDTSGKCTVATTIVDNKAGGYTLWKMKNPIPDSQKAFIDFSISLRTRQAKGTIMYLMGTDFVRNQSLELRMSNSQVVLTINIGDFSFKDITVPNKNVSDGAWHNIQVRRALNFYEVLLDGGDINNYAYLEEDISSPYNYMKMNEFVLAGMRVKLKSPTDFTFDSYYDNLIDSCYTDARINGGWMPIKTSENNLANAVANVVRAPNRGDGCPNTNVCPATDTCVRPLVCVTTIWRPLTSPSCSCPVGFAFLANLCVPVGVCSPNPCFRGSCRVSTAFSWGYQCICPNFYSGQRCEIFAGAGVASLDAGIIVLIVIVILLILLAIFLYCFCVRYRRRGDKLLDYPDEDTRENVCHYDEEGAGEEDHGGYDLTHLRKPIHNDITPAHARPLKSAPPHDHTDLGHFLNGKLKDAEKDPHGPPQDYSLDYGYEGQGSVVDDLSSLGSGTSDGSQHYDHLHKMGPKFKPLHDLYNHNHKA